MLSKLVGEDYFGIILGIVACGCAFVFGAIISRNVTMAAILMCILFISILSAYFLTIGYMKRNKGEFK